MDSTAAQFVSCGNKAFSAWRLQNGDGMGAKWQRLSSARVTAGREKAGRRWPLHQPQQQRARDGVLGVGVRVRVSCGREGGVVEVLEGLGLSRPEMAVVLAKCPALVKEELEQLVGFLSELNFGAAEIGQRLLKHPPLLRCGVDNMRQVTLFLLSVGLEDVGSIAALRPQVLTHPVDRVKSVVGSLMEAGVPVEEVERIMKKAPELLSAVTERNVKAKLTFLVAAGLKGSELGKAIARRPNILNFSLERMGRTAVYLHSLMGEKKVSKLIKRYAEVLVLDPTRNMFPVVNFLVNLGVKHEDLGKVILRRPQLLGYTLNGMQPTVDYLINLGVQQHMLGKVITISPQVLTLNVEDKLKPVVEFFRQSGLTKERDMALLLTRNAQILCCSIEQNLRPKFDFFVGLGLRKEEIADMIVLFPSMLGQSIDASLAPKSYYLINVMHRSVLEVVGFPQYFGYSLEKRIKPRHEKLAEKGVHASLASMLACVEGDFELRYIIGKPPNRAPYRSRRKDQGKPTPIGSFN